jgi:poly(3-hydroxybutyrate) depolymerase
MTRALALLVLGAHAGGVLLCAAAPVNRTTQHGFAAASSSSAAAASSAAFARRYGPSSGCGLEPPYVPGGERESLSVDVEIDGLQRNYLLHLPTSYDRERPTPLIMSFHGWSMSAQNNWNWMGFKEVVEAENFIIVHPNGIRDCLGQQNCWSSWNAMGCSNNTADAPQGWTCAPSTSNCQACAESCQPLGLCNSQQQRNCNWCTCVDDVSFVSALLDQLEAKLCVDRARVFASGESLGGLMAFEVGTKLADRFAAVAPTVGAPLVGFDVPPAGTHQISFLSLWGRNDNVIPPGGGQSNDGWFYVGVDDYSDTWATYNSCNGAQREWENPVGSGPGNTNLNCVMHRGDCEAPGTDVVHCAFQGNHFSQINGYFGRLAYDFFERHPKTPEWWQEHRKMSPM